MDDFIELAKVIGVWGAILLVGGLYLYRRLEAGKILIYSSTGKELEDKARASDAECARLTKCDECLRSEAAQARADAARDRAEMIASLKAPHAHAPADQQGDKS